MGNSYPLMSPDIKKLETVTENYFPGGEHFNGDIPMGDHICDIQCMLLRRGVLKKKLTLRSKSNLFLLASHINTLYQNKDL